MAHLSEPDIARHSLKPVEPQLLRHGLHRLRNDRDLPLIRSVFLFGTFEWGLLMSEPAMSDDFNPYRKWLGIPKNRTPANHYDILGVSLDEEDPEVIRGAAEQRRSYVEQQRGLGHDKAVKKILYQLDEAEMTLLDVKLRRDYDKRLRLFKKRKKRRQVDRVPGRSRVHSRPGKTVGEDSGIARQFAAIVAILCVAFGAMYWWANRTYEPATGVSSPSGNTVADSRNVGNGGNGVPLPKPPDLGGANSAKDPSKPPEPPADIQKGQRGFQPAVVTNPKPEVEIIETKSQDYRKSSTDYARAEGTRFSVGMGNQGGGYGIAAYGWRVKNVGSVEVNATLSGDIKVIDQDSFVGVVVDFLGPNGQWTKRVGINGFPQRLNRSNGVPNWGTRRKPDSILNVESTGDLRVSLEEHAPSDWTGESWVTVLMQNTGLNTGASGTVRLIPNASTGEVTKRNRQQFEQAVDEPPVPVGFVRAFQGHKKQVSSVDFSPDGKLIVSGSKDRTIRLWDVATGQAVWEGTSFSTELLKVTFTPDGQRVLACDRTNLYVFESKTGQVVDELAIGQSDMVDISRDGEFLLKTHKQGDLIVFSLKTKREFLRQKRAWGSAYGVFDPSGEHVIYGEYNLDRRHLSSGRIQNRVAAQRGYFGDLAINPRGNILATGSERLWQNKTTKLGNCLVRLWDLNDGSEIAQFSQHQEWVRAVAFSPDGRGLLSGGGGTPSDWDGYRSGADCTLRFWNVEAQKLVREFNGHKAGIFAVAVSPDGYYAVSGSADKTVRLWRLPVIGKR